MKDVFIEKLKNSYSNTFEKELIEEIIKVGHFEKIYKDKLLIDIDDDLTHVPIIIDGVVKIVRKNEEGNELSLYYLEKGDTCSISFANCINRRKSIFRGT